MEFINNDEDNSYAPLRNPSEESIAVYLHRASTQKVSRTVLPFITVPDPFVRSLFRGMSL